MLRQGRAPKQADFILNRVKDKEARNSLIVPFDPVPDSKLGELTARFDIVLDRTPEN